VRKLELGAVEEAPPDARACWGAVATIRDGRWDIPHAQQDIVGDLEAREQLAEVMNGGAFRDAEMTERRLARERLFPVGARVVVLERRELVVLVAMARATDNAVKITAYIRKPKRVAARVSLPRIARRK
jgi:hypothetical protein